MHRMICAPCARRTASVQDPAFSFLHASARLFAALLVVVVIAGCASRRAAPVEDRGIATRPPAMPQSATPPTAGVDAGSKPAEAPSVGTYTVKRGDTLYQIALDNGLD